jgi:hypothetical protein
MLRSFRVANHKSIRDEQELVLLPAYDKARTVVPVAAIFGANAAGKSNVLDALRFMWAAVRNSYGQWEAGTGIPRTPFRLDPALLAEPSLFAVDLILEGIRYSYGFTVDDERVLEEWLHAYPHRRKSVVFERSHDSIELGSTLPDRKSRSDLLASLTRDNSLLLSSAIQAKQEEVVPVYRWFQRGLRFVRNRSTPLSTAGMDRIERALLEQGPLVDLLKAADLGISDLRIESIDEQPPSAISIQVDLINREIAALRQGLEEAPEAERGNIEARIKRLMSLADRNVRPRVRRQLVFLHGPGFVPMTINDESDGTVAWLNLVSVTLDTLAGGSVLVVDEIDASLHPRLTARLIELFKNEKTNRHGAQLIFATHDATLLGTSFGDEILARDEVWLVEKGMEGETALFPLTDFHPRREENTERRYLGGSYGAVPAVFSDTLVDRLAEVRGGYDDASSGG